LVANLEIQPYLFTFGPENQILDKLNLHFKNKEKPYSGCFLISDPFENDAFFERSVVFLCEHNDEGSFGFVLNNPLDLGLSTLLNSDEFPEDPVYVGGPVAGNQLFYLHDAKEPMGECFDCENGIYFSGDIDNLKEQFVRYKGLPFHTKFFIGYSGWSAGQLEGEIESLAWIVAKNIPMDFIFEKETARLWGKCMELQGPKFSMIAKFPKNPQEN